MSRHAVRIAIALVCTLPAHAAESCDPVNDALLKLAQTPNHSFTESSGAIAGGKLTQTERIATATASYLLISGKWHKSVMTPQQELQGQKEALKEKKNASCRFLREEVIQGESAALYTIHDEGEGGKSDTQIWISRARGLPVKVVIRLSVADGSIGQSQVTTRYVYENTRAPEGAQ